MKDILGYYDMVITESKTNHKLTTSKQLNTVLLSVIEYYFRKYNLNNTKTRIMITRIPKGLGGYIDISKLKETNKDNITLKIDKSLSFNGIIRFIAHELTHASQILRNELWYTDESIMWNGEVFITLKDYNKILSNARKSKDGMLEYNRLPWEIDAVKNEKSSIDDYKNSMECASLRDLDDVGINMILDSL